jgi:magnesium transporter
MRQDYRIDAGRVVEVPPGEGMATVYAAPTPEEREEIIRSCGIDDHTLRSALDPEEVPRVEIEEDHTLIIWKRPDPAMFRHAKIFEVSSVGIVLRPGHVTIVTAHEAAALARPRTRDVGSLNDLVLRELLDTVRHFFEHLRVIREIAREIQSKLATSIGNEHLLRMFALSEGLIYYLTAIESNGAVLARLRGATDRLGITPEEVRLLDDLIIENTQCARQAQVYSEVLSDLMDARASIINNNMNVLLKNLTVINVVFLPLSVIAGIGGMSEFTMMTGSAREMHGPPWWITYPLFILGLAIIGSLTWRALRRWMDRTMGQTRM